MEDFNFNNDNIVNDSDFEKTEYNYVVPEPKKPKTKKYGIKTIILCGVISALVAAIISATVSSALIARSVNQNNVNNTPQINSTQPNSNPQSTTIEISGTVESAIEAVAQKVNPSVVGIITTAATNSFFGGSTETQGEGSGIIYTTDGYIITNYHVIKDALNSATTKIEVYLSSNSESSYSANVVGYNISYDLAVLKINANGLTAIDLADSDSLKVGQFVAAVGSPGGLQFMGSVTYGIISGLNRIVSDSYNGSPVELIQTDAAINPGNSGGALVNTKGQLIGVNSSKIAATDYEGMGFAIPSNTVKEICNSIIEKENDPNPYIGITISEKYTAELLEKLNYPVGAVVLNVVNNGPAAKSGIRSGDIIVEYNSVAITDYNVLTEEIAKCSPGDTVTVKIYRSGKYYSTSIKVGSNNSQ